LKKRDETLSIIVVIVDGASPAAKMTRLTFAAADIQVDHSGRAAEFPNLRRILLAGAADEWASHSTNVHPVARTGRMLKLHFMKSFLWRVQPNWKNALSFRPPGL
jgi:hypothetical protein